MKAVFVTSHGGPEVLQLQDVAVPDPKKGQVRVQVAAAGVNYADLAQREGFYPGGPEPPYIAGFEISGVVDQLGAGVTACQVGDRVMGFCSSGYAEYVVTDAETLLRMPGGVDFVQAAAIPCQYFTAYHALFTLAGLKPDQTVLINAAAGGLGTQLVQLSKLAGAMVRGTCSSEEKTKLLQELRCDFPINYVIKDFEVAVKEITKGRGCDLVVECVGGEVFDKSLRCVRPRGRLIVLGVASREPATVFTPLLLMNNITVSGFHLGAYATDAGAMAPAVRNLYEWVESGSLRMYVGHTFSLENAADAHQLIASRKSAGKVVLTL
ncbi:MAG: NADPH:quinone oxidoreductase family protein [Candidatus Hydrogenedentes bacterium]|nr:NADPH:quinone oxidoreductase family protein [Candidatus Hydrogenedentota bacterium]